MRNPSVLKWFITRFSESMDPSGTGPSDTEAIGPNAVTFAENLLSDKKVKERFPPTEAVFSLFYNNSFILGKYYTSSYNSIG